MPKETKTPESGDMYRKFGAWIPVKAEYLPGDPEPGRLVGPCTSSQRDYDGEILKSDGVIRGLKMFEKLGGQIDFEHLYAKNHDPDFLIGRCIKIEVKDGIPWVTTQLRKRCELAHKVWRLALDGNELGYSIEGIALARDKKDHSIVLDIEVHRITLTPSPKNFQSRVEIVEKALLSEVESLKKGLIPESESGFEWKSVDFDLSKNRIEVIPDPDEDEDAPISKSMSDSLKSSIQSLKDFAKEQIGLHYDLQTKSTGKHYEYRRGIVSGIRNARQEVERSNDFKDAYENCEHLSDESRKLAKNENEDTFKDGFATGAEHFLCKLRDAWEEHDGDNFTGPTTCKFQGDEVKKAVDRQRILKAAELAGSGRRDGEARPYIRPEEDPTPAVDKIWEKISEDYEKWKDHHGKKAGEHLKSGDMHQASYHNAALNALTDHLVHSGVHANSKATLDEIAQRSRVHRNAKSKTVGDGAALGCKTMDDMIQDAVKELGGKFHKAMTTGGGIVQGGETGGAALRTQCILGGNVPARKKKSRRRKKTEDNALQEGMWKSFCTVVTKECDCIRKGIQEDDLHVVFRRLSSKVPGDTDYRAGYLSGMKDVLYDLKLLSNDKKPAQMSLLMREAPSIARSKSRSTSFQTGFVSGVREYVEALKPSFPEPAAGDDLEKSVNTPCSFKVSKNTGRAATLVVNGRQVSLRYEGT